MKKLTVLSFCIVFLFCVSISYSAIASDEEDVLKVATDWVEAGSTNNFELKSSLYWHSPDTSLYMPGNTPFLISGWEALEKSFKAHSEVPPGSFAYTLHNPIITMLEDDTAIVTAYNTVTINPPLVEQQITGHVRQTLVVQKINGKWLIVHEHGSRLPTE